MPAFTTSEINILPDLNIAPVFPTGNMKYEPLLICFRSGPLTNEVDDPPVTAFVPAFVIVREFMELVVIIPFVRFKLRATCIPPFPVMVSPDELFSLRS